MSQRPFVVYDTRTGQILRYGLTSHADVSLQASAPHEAALEAAATDLTHRVVDGQLIAIEDTP